MRRILLTLLAVKFVLVGMGLVSCIENPIEPQEAVPLAIDHRNAPQFDKDVIQSVSGSGHLTEGAIYRTVTFNILKRVDGTVEGWYRSLRRGRGGARIRVRVECLHVTGNQAWASGSIVAALDPGNIGRPYSFRFIDNGEGANAPPDEIGVERFEDYDCELEPDIATRQIKIGNLQIRD